MKVLFTVGALARAHEFLHVVGLEVLRPQISLAGAYTEALLHGVVIGRTHNQEVVVAPRDGRRLVIHLNLKRAKLIIRPPLPLCEVKHLKHTVT